MRKKFFVLAVVSLMVCLIGLGGVAYACDGDKDKDGKSKPGHRYLYQKCPPPADSPQEYLDFCTPGVVPSPPLPDRDMDRVRRGAWGKLEYRSSGPIFKFEFEGHGLKPLDPEDRSYTLIYYPENFASGSGLIYLGSDVADKHGNVHIKGSLDTGSLPAPYLSDLNCILDGATMTCLEGSGAKIWLVLSSDICFRSYRYRPFMKDWNPDQYLFADDLIVFSSPENRDCD